MDIDTASDPRPQLAQLLTEARSVLSSKFFIKMLAILQESEDHCVRDVCDYVLQGLHDVFNRDQIIGEIRGLRRLRIEAEEYVQRLEEALKDLDSSSNNANA